MSALWYEYLEESGGEVISSKYFNHVTKSVESFNKFDPTLKKISQNVLYAKNYKGKKWWPIKFVEALSEGWLKIKYFGIDIGTFWWNINTDNNKIDRIKSIKWCVEHSVEWQCPLEGTEVNIEEILGKSVTEPSSLASLFHCVRSFEQIKVGGYFECWCEGDVGSVWPVKVLGNIGGRVKLAWFGCESPVKQFVMFYLDHRLRALGWAKEHGWRYCAPCSAAITVAISNADTFARGSPAALCKDLCNIEQPRDHSFEEGWMMEAVDPINPNFVRPAIVKRVLNQQYFLVELEGVENSSSFIGFCGLGTLMPANLSDVSGFTVHGLSNGRWYSHLTDTHPDKYAPHSAYFFPLECRDDDLDSAFLPGCKLEAVNPWLRDQVHAATVTRCMEGSTLVWLRLDSEPQLPHFLVDPRTSVDIFPVGWCEMVSHPLILPSPSPPPLLESPSYFDCDEITVFLHPHCFLGPFLSRSSATQILPRFIGPGHCLPVFRELFHLLLKVSHKPHKLKRLLQLDHVDDCHDLMATIGIQSPKSEHSNRNRRPDWLVEVPVHKRAIPEFCHQTALSLGACPWFITTSANYRCSLGCDSRLSAKAGEKMSLQRRKRLFSRPLTAAGLSYRSLKSRIISSGCNSSSNTEGDSSDDDTAVGHLNTANEFTMQTRGVRLPPCEPKRRLSRRKPFLHAGIKTVPLSPSSIGGGGRAAGNARDHLIGSPIEDLSQYAIDPTFLAGEIRRVTLASNPLHWSAEQVADYVSGTDCGQLAQWLAAERVDGPAFLLLTLPVLSSLCGLQLEAAIRLCKHVVSLKRAFVEQFVDCKTLLPPGL